MTVPMVMFDLGKALNYLIQWKEESSTALKIIGHHFAGWQMKKPQLSASKRDLLNIHVRGYIVAIIVE